MYNNYSDTRMQWKPRLKIYKGCNNKCTFNPESKQAYSYGWWLFVREVKGKIIFNDYSYSNTTSGHQSAVRSLLSSLNIKVDLCVDSHSSLTDLDKVLSDELDRLAKLMVACNNSKNQELLDSIRAQKEVVKTLKQLGAWSISDINELYDIEFEYQMDEHFSRLLGYQEKREAAEKQRRAKLSVGTNYVIDTPESEVA